MIYIKKLYLITFIFVFIIVLFNFSEPQAVASFFENPKYVYVLGDVVGIKANTDGVLVLDSEKDIEYIDKLKQGDNILYIEDQKISSSQEVYNILNKLKKDIVDITFERDGKIITKSIKTKKTNQGYKLGFWVRDKISGIGTMTLYDPEEDLFYAIGHPIYDLDTQKILKIKEGYICNLSNLKILKGSKKKIGQIKGDFEAKKKIGSFYKNFEYGIKGSFSKNLLDTYKKQKLQIADFNDIKLGKAKILFKPSSNKIKYYDILISNIDKQSKILEIEIIDKELINYTGGIIQGMSGTPIIQNNKLIGSIAYVLKNNPKKGFGIYIGEMVR